MPIVRRRCAVCDKEWDLLLMRGVLTALEHDDIEMIDCPACGGEGRSILAPSARDSVQFPYFDRGLGVEVQSRKHHRWLMQHEPNGRKRDVPLIPTHGEFDTDRMFDQVDNENAQVEADHKAYLDEMQNGPNRHDYARMNDFIANHGTDLWGDK